MVERSNVHPPSDETDPSSRRTPPVCRWEKAIAPFGAAEPGSARTSLAKPIVL
jgi:hypothetical protein